ncbi:MAG: AmmeMemoRadiSam system protein B [Chloroflexi bacterium]|nr:AmmeMemoRadiSam system protein B [Chloroflexota bacterium]
MDVRPSPIAGTWYSGNPAALTREIEAYLAAVRPVEPPGKVIGIIVPHAGHRYSGPVAAHAFVLLRGLTPDLVVVVSPYHQMAFDPLITTAHEAYSTPLGTIEVDREALSQLAKVLDIPISPLQRDKEHSLEIELPFLQCVLGGSFKILPIMVRAQESEISKRLGQTLAVTLRGMNFLLVASTDLSHFYDQATASILDREMLSRFESLDPQSIFDAERQGKGYACGHAAVAAVLWAGIELGADKVSVLDYATSGDVTGDHSSVVGYGAAVITKPV